MIFCFFWIKPKEESFIFGVKPYSFEEACFLRLAYGGDRRYAAVRAIKPEHVVYDIAESINAQFTQRLCRNLLVKHPGKKIYVICDHARYNRCTWLQQWVEKQRIEFVFFALFSQLEHDRTALADLLKR